MNKPLHIHTPVVESRPLSEALGRSVHLKLESVQPSGSFKIRGIGEACRISVEEGARSLVASSGGNAGLAVAWSGRQLGVPVTVVVPQTTSQHMRALIQREGASVVEHGAAWDAAHQHALQLAAASEDAAIIHPFDDERIWSGHATLISELAEDGYRPEALVVAVGGGGLLCGVLRGLEQVGWAGIPVVAVETRGTASLAASLEAGRLVTLPRITSIATSLGALTVAPRAFEWSRSRPVVSWVVSDELAIDACLRFADDHRMLVEPACGAVLAALYGRAEPCLAVDEVLAIVCGGSGVTREMLAGWEARRGSGG